MYGGRIHLQRYISDALLISPCAIIHADPKGSDKVVECSRRMVVRRYPLKQMKLSWMIIRCPTGPGQHAKLLNLSNIDQETLEMKRGEFDSGWRVKFSEIKSNYLLASARRSTVVDAYADRV
jgi:hypothetical protein